jgi:hypothetical protein
MGGNRILPLLERWLHPVAIDPSDTCAAKRQNLGHQKVKRLPARVVSIYEQCQLRRSGQLRHLSLFGCMRNRGQAFVYARHSPCDLFLQIPNLVLHIIRRSVRLSVPEGAACLRAGYQHSTTVWLSQRRTESSTSPAHPWLQRKKVSRAGWVICQSDGRETRSGE